MHYNNQAEGGWAMGTGWLISDDVFVTASHCSYDRAYQMRHATQVKAYIGYGGHDPENSPTVQSRLVKRITTTKGWLKAGASKPYDVSFMQVDTPFTGITPIKPQNTPANCIEMLGVVGYPGDKVDPKTGENGAQMYEMYLKTRYDLGTQSDGMLEHVIDTVGGNYPSKLQSKDLSSDMRGQEIPGLQC